MIKRRLLYKCRERKAVVSDGATPSLSVRGISFCKSDLVDLRQDLDRPDRPDVMSNADREPGRSFKVVQVFMKRPLLRRNANTHLTHNRFRRGTRRRWPTSTSTRSRTISSGCCSSPSPNGPRITAITAPSSSVSHGTALARERLATFSFFSPLVFPHHFAFVQFHLNAPSALAGIGRHRLAVLGSAQPMPRVVRMSASQQLQLTAAVWEKGPNFDSSFPPLVPPPPRSRGLQVPAL